MTGLPPPPPSPPPSEPPSAAWAPAGADRPNGSSWVVWLLGGFVVVAIALGALVVFVLGPESSSSTAVEAPAEWDPRIEPIAEFVADARDLDWAHPVAVRFAPEDAFVDEVVTDDAEVSDEAREELVETQRMMEALSVLPPDVDLREALDDTASTAVLAYYSPETEEIVVRGDDLDVRRRATLAHELTHALQDQHFDLSRLQEEADEQGTSSGILAVIEGDAERIKSDYVQSLRADERTEFAEATADEAGDIGEALRTEDVPEVMQVLFGFPYAMGPQLVDIVVTADGQRAVDDLFRPDVTEADVLTPIRLLDGVEPEGLSAPELPPGAEETAEEEPFGATGWFFTLAARIDAGHALDAADGWNGDNSIGYEVDGVPCIAASFVGQTSFDTDTMAAALEAWVAAGPAGAADVERDVGTVVLHACAEGTAPGPSRSLLDALAVAAARSAIFAELSTAAPDPALAWCVANELAFDPELAAVFTSDQGPSPETQAMIAARAQTASVRCLSG